MVESNSKNNIRKSDILKEWVIPIVSAIILSFLINKFLFFNVSLPPSGSMIPTLNNYDRALVSKIYDTNNIKRGDIIVFNSEELSKTLVKRLIGLPGDKIEINNGIVSVNGNQLEEDYVKNKDQSKGTFKVPEGKFFFLGDNRPISNDSRFWKNPYIDSSDIKGKLQFRYYPLKDFGIVN